MDSEIRKYIQIVEEFEMENSDWLSINESEILCEFANIPMKYTDLPTNIWLDEHGSARNMKHNIPRLKFQNNHSIKVDGTGIPISISKEPEILIKNSELKISAKDLKEIKQFIINNYDLLMKHWNQEIDTFDFIKEIKKI